MLDMMVKLGFEHVLLLIEDLLKAASQGNAGDDLSGRAYVLNHFLESQRFHETKGKSII